MWSCQNISETKIIILQIFLFLLNKSFFSFLYHYCCILKVEPDSRRIFSKKFTFTVLATSCHPKYFLFYILKKQFSLFIISNRRFDSATTNRPYFCFFITLFLSTYRKIYNEWTCKAKWLNITCNTTTFLQMHFGKRFHLQFYVGKVAKKI